VGSTPASVLVIDDDPSIRLLCRVNLELDGYRVLEAATLARAREILNAEHVDCVLLDVHVGGDTGYDLLDELRAGEHGLGVALFTGSATIDDNRRAEVQAVLPKPFTLEQLAETVRRLLDYSTDVESHIR
jgi:DNA-binding NtrC family response regulator